MKLQKNWDSGPTAVSDLASGLLDPIMRKRAGISIEIVQSWAEIVGDRLATVTRPIKINWQRRLSDEDPFEPATLVIACTGAAALRVQHETMEIISRVNSFLGFAAIGRVKIVQKQLTNFEREKPAPQRAMNNAERDKLDHLTQYIDDDGLRESLKRLGASILARKKPLANL